jgi:hypothetical protein
MLDRDAGILAEASVEATSSAGLASLSAPPAARGGLPPGVAGQVAASQRLRELVPPTAFLLVSVAVVGLPGGIDRGPDGSPPQAVDHDRAGPGQGGDERC